MATLIVKNLRSIPDATIDLSGAITLIAGPNRAGKSSLMMALKACLSGTTAVLLGKGNFDCQGMRAEGSTGEASAVLHDDKGSWVCRWSLKTTHPRRSKHDPSHLPNATQSAAGCPSFLDLEAKDRPDVFFETFGVEPTKENLLSAIGDQDIDGQALWDDIQIQDWDPALKIANEKLRKLKASWQGVTQETWTEDGGSTWAPESGAETVSDADFEALQRNAIAAEETRLSARSALEAFVVPPGADDVLSCPDCENKLILVGGELLKAEPASDDVVAEARRKREDLATASSDAASKAREAEASLNTASALRQRDDSKRAERIARAEEIDQAIRSHLPVIEILGPDGVRATIRNRVIEMVNVRLASFSDIMEIPPVTLSWGPIPGKNTPTITASLGNRPFFALCNSEKWMVSALVQIAIATGDGSTMVLLDDAETCVGEYREKLALLAIEIDLQVVMAMAVGDPSIPPDLEQAGFGKTYWVENGRVVPFGQVAVQEAA